MKKLFLHILSSTALSTLVLLTLLSACRPGSDIDRMVENMTLEEKVGQLLCPLGWPMYEKVSADSVAVSEEGHGFLEEKHGGFLWAAFRADPWTQKTLETGLGPELERRLADRFAASSAIPVGLMEEAPHGHMAIGATVFPTGIGLASTWHCSLVEVVGSVIGRELKAVGATMGLGPVIDLARDPRWSRVEETFGEDSFLAGEMAYSMVSGTARSGIPSTVKHFIAYGVPEGGHNGNPSSLGERELREQYLPPFRRAVEAGAGGVMTSYNSLDGIPSTANEKLLTGVLRDEWGFGGVVVSDLGSIDGLASTHRVAAGRQEAAEMALRAGVDIDLGAGCYPLLVNSVKEGRIPESLVDRAVRRVLRIKYSGQGHKTLTDAPGGAVNDRNAVATALTAALESVTLLKNNGVLPLREGMRIALVGPNADNVYNQLGDYTAPQPEGKVVTMLDGLLARGATVKYVKGCSIRDTCGDSISEAVMAARSSDVIVAVVGGSSARDFRTSYEETGAAVTDAAAVSDMESGEGFDRSSLDLMGLQPELLAALKATGRPLVVVYIEGRPLDKRWASAKADALLTMWYPGEQGGTALADVLFGDYNPAGRLPVSVPRDAGQIPVYYSRRVPSGHDYVEEPAAPLYPFGYGLSYTTFSYGPLSVAEGTVIPSDTEAVTVTLNVTNTGGLDGDEVVQIYLIDEIASTVRPRKQLCGFARVNIPAGGTVPVTITIPRRCFEMTDISGSIVIEPGTFLLQAGASSEDIRSEIRITYE